ncbi:MAG TPA: subclass B3 metallo-beta-lactamase [Steroidobacteraceae bacterium]|nr:subclass B3 metallo-beta-lactamase [Steroidobacteraceae bacterium]
MSDSRLWARRAATPMVKILALASFSMAVGAASAPDLAARNQPHKPFQIIGNTYYVGTAGIASLLITSDFGHVLVDTGLPESAPLIARNIEELGFKLADVKGIVFSHPHADHVGGLAELQKLTGAQVYSLRAAEEVLRTGKLPKDDPQHGARSPAIPKISRNWIVTDGQLLGIGSLRLRVFATPGHTPGSATWTWDACEGSKCLAFVYADSLSPVSADKYRFKDHPETVAAFESSLKVLESLPCELLMTPHPDAARLAKLEAAKGSADALKEEGACKQFAQQRRGELQARLAAGR